LLSYNGRFPPKAAIIAMVREVGTNGSGIVAGMIRVVLAASATSFFKMFAMCVYSAWAFKLAVIDSQMNPLISIPMVALSIYGLWVIVARIANRIEAMAPGD
jgi:hypothetical protein